ncbi:MAG: terpene cyclase/mutase family protein [Planctomycetes bacterium]|nr:terpene cyclase/mutase family protein [Planctomycetota bacterium]
MATSRMSIPAPDDLPPEEEELVEEEQEEEQELPPGEPQTFTDKLVAKTPWWGMSIGIHVVMALFMAYLIAAGKARPDEEAVVVAAPRKPRPIPEMEKPKDLQQNKPLDMKKAVEDPVFKKNAEESDHNETADEEEFQKAKGDSLDFVSDKPFKGKGTYDTIGGGGGGGGRYGGRLGGKRNLVARGGGGDATEDAVLAALKWLSRHQNGDGSWSVVDHTKNCGKVNPQKYPGQCGGSPGHGDFDTGVTGLSLLAFLGAGYSHLSKDTYDGICFGDVVRKGLQWMMSHQDPEGCIGPRTAQKYAYNHHICALAISEAYGLTGSNLFKDQAQKSVDFTVASQNPSKAWRYSYKSGDNDSSVTGWAVMVLKSAELSGLTFPRTSYDGARAWFDEVTDEAYGRVGYIHKGTGKVFVVGMNEHFSHHEALSAIAVMSRIFMDRTKADPRITNGCDLLLKDLPQWKDVEIDYYYWYYASLALFQYDGPSGPKWKAWNEKMKDALVKNQNMGSAGCKHGSWDPIDRWSGEGGRVYGTAINALTLEVYYRYANVFGVK